MKILNLIPKAAIALSLITAITISSCSSSSDEAKSPAPQPSGPVNSGSLNLIAIDTAKVVKMTENGSSPLVVLNRKLNQNSYMSDFCFSPDGTKFIYVDQQASGVVPNFVKSIKLKIANIDGTGDTDLFTAQNALQGSSISSIRYCSDGKIFFAYKMATSNGSATALNYNIINPDGTGLTSANAASYGEYFNVSNDRRFYSNIASSTGNNGFRWYIYDKTLDGGAGGVHSQVDFAQTIELAYSSISNDGKIAVLPYKDGNTIKLKIVDMTTKVASDKTILSGLAAGYTSFRFHLASDSVRGVLTMTGQNYPKSKSYVFNTSTGVASAPFENNDENIIDVFAF